MNRQELVLASLAPSEGAQLSPVQVQKLLFIVDRSIGDLVGGPYFDFRPYHYGPFDSAVYREIEGLEARGLAEVVPGRSWRVYRLTSQGIDEGKKVLARLPAKAQAFIPKAVEFVQSLSFTQLVSAIYKAFPEMRENSVFQE